MTDVNNFDPSRRTHWRSDDDLKRIHRNLPWNRRAQIKWSLVASAFVCAAAVTQLGVWEYQAIQARKLELATISLNRVWKSCGEVREAGVAPLFKGDPGYNRFLDADGDGIACEPYQGSELRILRWRAWRQF